jgi:hypothetical protein
LALYKEMQVLFGWLIERRSNINKKPELDPRLVHVVSLLKTIKTVIVVIEILTVTVVCVWIVVERQVVDGPFQLR